MSSPHSGEGQAAGGGGKHPQGERNKESAVMAWDFCTDPDFQQQLDWIRDIVINQIEPLDLVKDEMSPESWRRATQPIKQQVKDQGLWAAHLDPELGGLGMGQVRLALMHEILGRTRSAPDLFGNQAPASRNSEHLDI